jgi:hypothetical protein
MTIKVSRLGLAAAVIAAGVISILFTGSALAQFANDPFDGKFTEGSLSITGRIDEPLFAGRPITPGDEQTTPVIVRNDGTLDLRYAIASKTSEDALAARLLLTIWQADAGSVCNSPPEAGALYGPAPLGSTRGISVIGDPAQGAQAGDRTLASGATETLCFGVTAPLSLDNEFQGRGTQPVFHFEAEQLEQNP